MRGLRKRSSHLPSQEMEGNEDWSGSEKTDLNKKVIPGKMGDALALTKSAIKCLLTRCNRTDVFYVEEVSFLFHAFFFSL